jgi:hypothetical protein
MEGTSIKLTDFASQCGVTVRAIQKHLKNMENELEGHYERRGVNGTWVDEIAVNEIKKRMVTPPAPVISNNSILKENEELKKALINLQTKYIEMQEKLIIQSELLSESVATKKLLNEATERETALKAEVEEARARAEQAAQREEESNRQREEAFNFLEIEKNRRLSFKERILGKKL